MMELLLDIGNTSVNWALLEKDKYSHTGIFYYDKSQIENSFQKKLVLPEKPSRVLVANVAGGNVYAQLADWVNKNWQCELWQATVTEKFNELKNSYSDVQQMGVDRWCAMVASWHTHQSAICLIGCGTALTADLIDSKGQHLGGFIMPGITLMQHALVNNTEQIDGEIKNQASLDYAKDTQTAINNGAFIASVSMIDAVSLRFAEELGQEPKYILSGGMGEMIKPLLNRSFEYAPNLVLEGLSLLHKASL